MTSFENRVDLNLRVSHVVFEPQKNGNYRKLFLSLSWDQLKGQDDVPYKKVYYQVFQSKYTEAPKDSDWNLLHETGEFDAVVTGLTSLGLVSDSVIFRVRAVVVLDDGKATTKVFHDELTHEFVLPPSFSSMMKGETQKKKLKKKPVPPPVCKEKMLAKAYIAPTRRNRSSKASKHRKRVTKLIEEADETVHRQLNDTLKVKPSGDQPVTWVPNTIISDVKQEHDQIRFVEPVKAKYRTTVRLAPEVATEERKIQTSPVERRKTRIRFKSTPTWEATRRTSLQFTPRSVMKPVSSRTGLDPEVTSKIVRLSPHMEAWNRRKREAAKEEKRKAKDAELKKERQRVLNRKKTAFRQAELAEIGRIGAMVTNEEYKKKRVEEPELSLEEQVHRARKEKENSRLRRLSIRKSFTRPAYSFNRPGVAGWLMHEFGSQGNAEFMSCKGSRETVLPKKEKIKKETMVDHFHFFYRKPSMAPPPVYSELDPNTRFIIEQQQQEEREAAAAALSS